MPCYLTEGPDVPSPDELFVCDICPPKQYYHFGVCVDWCPAGSILDPDRDSRMCVCEVAREHDRCVSVCSGQHDCIGVQVRTTNILLLYFGGESCVGRDGVQNCASLSRLGEPSSMNVNHPFQPLTSIAAFDTNQGHCGQYIEDLKDDKAAWHVSAGLLRSMRTWELQRLRHMFRFRRRPGESNFQTEKHSTANC